MSFFFNNKHELRSGWKFVVYCIFLVILGFATQLLVTTVVSQRGGVALADQLFLIALNQVTVFVPAVGAMLLTIIFVDHRPFRTFGIGFLPQWKSQVLLGIGIAAAMLAVVVLGSYAVGYVSMRWTATQVSAGLLLATLGILLVAAASEELLFRGFPLQLLMEAMGEWPAMIGMSALFGAVHLGNPNVSVLGVVNTIAAGILLSLAYVKTRSLWLPYAIHVAWNAGLGFVFGFPLSGIDLPSLWTTGTAGSETILGGGYGPEGGFLCTFIFATAALMVKKYGSIYSTEALTSSAAGRNNRD